MSARYSYCAVDARGCKNNIMKFGYVAFNTTNNQFEEFCGARFVRDSSDQIMNEAIALSVVIGRYGTLCDQYFTDCQSIMNVIHSKKFKNVLYRPNSRWFWFKQILEDVGSINVQWMPREKLIMRHVDFIAHYGTKTKKFVNKHHDTGICCKVTSAHMCKKGYAISIFDNGELVECYNNQKLPELISNFEKVKTKFKFDRISISLPEIRKILGI